jgi:hypothetical protein
MHILSYKYRWFRHHSRMQCKLPSTKIYLFIFY